MPAYSYDRRAWFEGPLRPLNRAAKKLVVLLKNGWTLYEPSAMTRGWTLAKGAEGKRVGKDTVDQLMEHNMLDNGNYGSWHLDKDSPGRPV